MNNASLLQLLGTSAGVKELVSGGKRFGVSVEPSNHSNVLDFGTVNTEDLENIDAPRGYEAFSNPSTTLSKVFRVSYTNQYSDLPPHFTLSSYTTLPKSNPQHYSIEITCNGEDPISCSISRGQNVDFEVHLTVYENYEGFLGQWLLLTFQGWTEYGLTATVSYQFVTAVRVSGRAVTSRTKRLLSVEAKPFISQLASAYFDSTVVYNLYDLFSLSLVSGV